MPSLRKGSEHYELTLLPGFSNGVVDFLIGGGECTRLEKMKELVDFPLAQKYLNVCWQFESCGRCGKCYRTLLGLDILGALDRFRGVFDIDRYRADGRVYAIAYMLCHRHREDMEEVYEQFKAAGMHIPFLAYAIFVKKGIMRKIARMFHPSSHGRPANR